MLERTLAIIKPDAVQRRATGRIIAMMEDNDLTPVAMQRSHLSSAEARAFYAVHNERPFYADLVAYMTSGPVVLLVLEGKDAVRRYRALMGATDPKKADAGTIRAEYGASIEANAVHGSDSGENARKEITFFFAGNQIG